MHDTKGGQICASGAVLNKTWLAKSLLKGVIEPALRQNGITDDVGKKPLVVKVNGKLVPDAGQAKASYFATPEYNPSGGPVEVMVVLPPQLEPVTFNVDIKRANGEIISETTAQLNHKMLAKPPHAMLVQPALAAANVIDIDLSAVRVFFPDATDGLENEVDFNRLAKAHTRDFSFTANRSAERVPVSVIIMLPPTAQTMDDLSTFLVQIVYRGTVLSEMETQLQVARPPFCIGARPPFCIGARPPFCIGGAQIDLTPSRLSADEPPRRGIQ